MNAKPHVTLIAKLSATKPIFLGTCKLTIPQPAKKSSKQKRLIMDPSNPIVALWEVSGETYDALYQEAMSDAALFMTDCQWPYQVEVMNCSPLESEESRVITWKGKAVITLT